MKTAMHLLLLCVVAVVVSAGIVDVPIARRALVPRDDDDCGKGAFGGVVSSNPPPTKPTPPVANVDGV
jgi:hypothetical protein